MSLSFPISSLSLYGVGQVGGGTQAPALLQGVSLIVSQNDAPSGAVSLYPWSASDPSALTGQVPGSMIYGLGSYAGQVYVAKDDGTVMMWLDNGTVVAPLSASTLAVDTISGKTGTTGTFVISLADNLASALVIKEASNAYLTFVTTDSGEKITVSKRLDVAAGFASTPATVQNVDTGGTITLPTAGITKRVATSSAADKTGVILTAGTVDGQFLHLLNVSANSLTFAASGTSNVALGASAAIAAGARMSLIWDSTSSMWYA